MPRKESLYPQEWVKVATKDWRRMEQAFRDGDAEEAGFWLQQAVEKYLKAYLLSKGWVLRKIHDLEPLVSEAATRSLDARGYAEVCRKISGYYVAERYPSAESPSLTSEEVTRSRDEVKGLIQLIQKELK